MNAMERDDQINIRLTEQRKHRWKEAAEGENRSLSEFIRWCVELELRDGTHNNTEPRQNDGELDAIIESIQSLEATIDGGPGSISHRLQAIEGQLIDDPHARELATAVYGLLPAEDQLTTLPDFDDPSARVGENGRVVTGDPEHIAQYMCYSPDIDADPSSTQVQQALDNLQADMHNVHRLADGRYYRS